ncbi:dsrm domain-containing protein [Cephalotus follicularis]|uniref:Dsrm domain-containing protein n=1 Tax=Cephalotus follicularis TaxID=3775 RepID=A0A1Q3BFN5_CEPFO|nr:dsrm domain-containing protein [Cephalotus follicularis]
MPTNEGFSGVSNCYVFKSRLQEYAQKTGITTPVYETIKEGPSHQPCFRSTVIVNDVRYDSLPGFFNRKAAEQSAAEVALVDLTKFGEVNDCISQPIQETGLCKNLLQEYAQKMNYAIPLYQCQREEVPGRVPHFSCTVEIGGIRYIGAAAKTKKEAEIKAARTALLAIQLSSSDDNLGGNSQYTVIPCRKRGIELANNTEAANVPKAKKARFRKKMLKRKGKLYHKRVKRVGNSDVHTNDQPELKFDQTDASGVILSGSQPTLTSYQSGIADINPSEISVAKGWLVPYTAVDSQSGNVIAGNSNQSNHELSDLVISSTSWEVIPATAVNNSTLSVIDY